MATRPHPHIRGDRGVADTEAIEDYAKAIYALARRAGGPVGTSALAERLGVSPGTVTAMLKRMAEAGLVKHEPYHGVSLSPAGEQVALEVIRHHRLLESYLADALGIAARPDHFRRAQSGQAVGEADGVFGDRTPIRW